MRVLKDPRNELWRGFRDNFPIVASIAPFGAIYGAAAAETGLSLFDGVLLSALTIAGASQFVALGMWSEPLTIWTIVLMVVAVNFRHVLYSASLSRKLVNFTPLQKYLSFITLTDPSFALSVKRHDTRPLYDGDVGLTPLYCLGMGIGLYPMWVGSSALGMIFGRLIERPELYGLDFVLPLYFMVLLMGFRAKPHWLVIVLVSSAVSFLTVKTIGAPWHITCGGLAGILCGAMLPLKKDESDHA